MKTLASGAIMSVHYILICYVIMEIKDKVVIVTGSSQGIGLAIAKELAGRGAKVVLSARGLDNLKKAEAEIEGSFAVQADMRKPDDIKKLIDAAVEKFGRVDILINNAGQGMWKPVEEIDLESQKSLMELNYYGPLLAMQAVIPHMRKQGGGAIINISSASAKVHVVQNLAAYASTKYALSGMTLIAREELAKDNIVVSVVYPILVLSEFGNHSVAPEPEWLRHPTETSPKLPMIMPEDVAKKIAEVIETGEAETVVNGAA